MWLKSACRMNFYGLTIVTIVGGQIVYQGGHLNTQIRGQALTFNASVRVVQE
jgi:hypothetical protein